MRKLTLFGAILGYLALLSGCEVNVHHHEHDHPPGQYKVTYDDCSYVIYQEYYDCNADTIAFIRLQKFDHPSDAYALLYIAHIRSLDIRVVVGHYHQHHDLYKVAINFGCKPDVFIVDIPGHVHVSGPPYGKAYGYYRKHGRADELTHVEIRDLVELRIMVEYYGHDPEKAIRWKEGGKHFHDFAVEHHHESGKGANAKGHKVEKKDRPWEKHEKEHKAEDVKDHGKDKKDEGKPGKDKEPGKKKDEDVKKADKKPEDKPGKGKDDQKPGKDKDDQKPGKKSDDKPGKGKDDKKPGKKSDDKPGKGKSDKEDDKKDKKKKSKE